MKIFASKSVNNVADKISASQFAWLHQTRLTLNQLFVRHKLLAITSLASILFLLLILITVLVEHQKNTVSSLAVSENKHSLTMLNQLKDIDSQLQTMAASPQNSDDFKSALIKLNNDVSGLKSSINEVAKSADIQKVSGQISLMNQDIDSQILDLKRTVTNAEDSRQYLDPKILPFHVISVDVISQQPYVSISYASHVTPLTIGDSIAGWQIASADYDTAQVEFKNDKDQYVKVALQG